MGVGWTPFLPDLIHCHDWMCGLIPAAAGFMGSASLFAVSDLHTCFIPVSPVHDMGLDIAPFWQELYYSRMPCSFEEVCRHNQINMLASGIWAASKIDLCSGRAAQTLGGGADDKAEGHLRALLRKKSRSGRIMCRGGPPLGTQDYISLCRSIMERDKGHRKSTVRKFKLSRSRLYDLPIKAQ